MCNRVRASFEFREVKVRWKLFNDLPEFKPSDNVVPDRDGKLAIIHNEQGNEGRLMYWALIPSFAEGMELPYSTINARDDHLLKSRTYSRLLNNRRCLIPTTGFYEGQGRRPPKIPFFTRLKSEEPFALAGLWDTWKQPDGKILQSFTIITTGPNTIMRRIHNRMPVILHREDEEKWLDCAANPFETIQSLLKPFPPELMEAYEVSQQIYQPGFDGAACIASVEEQLSLL
jgi:putative SOS response-associated peptidase YedK